MKTFLKAVGSTALTFVPILIKQYAGDHWAPWAFLFFGSAVFLSSLKLFKPDERFLTLRPVAVELAVKEALKDIEKKGHRLRANVYERRGIWPFTELVPLVSCNTHTPDPDHGKRWPRGRGLCWKVYRTGKFGICHKGVDDPKDFGMRDADIQSTEHVEAVLCLPLRRKIRHSKDAPVSERVVGVLAYDALTPQGAKILQAQHDALRGSGNQPLLDLVDRVSLYF